MVEAQTTRKTSSPVVTHATPPNSEVISLIGGRERAIVANVVERKRVNILRKDTALGATVLSIPERDFRQQVIDLLRVYHWRFYFTWNSIHSPPGFPDIVAVRGSRLIFAELKSETGKVRPEQETWLADLKLTGNETYLWRPSDFDTIEEVLR
jgi:hypothetical protein